MKIAYFDCFSGASGDMILGSLLDAGLKLETLKESLSELGLSDYDVEVEKVLKKGIGASKAMIDTNEDDCHSHRNLNDIRGIIEKSALDVDIKKKSIGIFERLAKAEAKVHRSDIENIHFHEVGAMDAIIDVVGAVAGMHSLGIETVFCSPFHVGTGTIKCHHGVLPVPAPATAELLKGKPIYSAGIRGELVTPTGAAILTTLSSEFGPIPMMKIGAVGYGAGTADLTIPNLLRVTMGDFLGNSA